MNPEWTEEAIKAYSLLQLSKLAYRTRVVSATTLFILDARGFQNMKKVDPTAYLSQSKQRFRNVIEAGVEELTSRNLAFKVKDSHNEQILRGDTFLEFLRTSDSLDLKYWPACFNTYEEALQQASKHYPKLKLIED